MCLYYSEKATAKLKERLAKAGKIVAYKKVRVQRTYKPNTPFGGGSYGPVRVESFARQYKWRPGLNRSNRPRKSVSDREKSAGINRGIHVCLSPRGLRFSDGALMRVVCLARDLVAAGAFSQYQPRNDQAVFTKVRLLPAEYKRLTKMQRG